MKSIKKIINTYQLVSSTLTQYSESNLAYILGNHINNIPALQRKKKFYGLHFRVIIFFHFLMSNFSNSQPPKQSFEYFIYAGSKNQYLALESTIQNLDFKKAIVAFNPRIFKILPLSNCHSIKIGFSPSIILISLGLFLIRFISQVKTVSKIHPVAIGNFFNTFCMPYAYLPAFIKLLGQLQPKFVIMSNDHSVANRCLLAAAKQLNISTVYLQHAAVSNIFPPLDFDFSFLDGQSSLDIYMNLYKNLNLSNNVNKYSVFLSGNKKVLNYSSDCNPQLHVGLALNPLDVESNVTAFLQLLMTYNFLLNIRLHPSLKISHDLLQFCSKYPSISIHNAPDIPLTEFLKQCSFLVASDSSILLEAALSHTPVYYYKLSDTSFKFDYYGFVSSGICIDLTVNTTEILTSIVNDGPVLTSKTALQHHSSSFGTSMEGKEGCIVASTLDEISSQQSTFSFFKLKERTFGWCIYDLSVE